MSTSIENIRRRAEEVISRLEKDGEIREIIARLQLTEHMLPAETICETENRALYYSLVDTSTEKFSLSDSRSVIIRPLRDVIRSGIDVENPWSLASPEEDPHLALIARYGEERGAYVRVRSHTRAGPIRTCYVTRISGTVQLVHNVYVVEDNAELQVLSTCTAPYHALDVYHVSLTEVKIGRNSKFTMIMYHNWNDTVKLWSSLRIHAGPGSRVIVVYITHSPIEKMRDQVIVDLYENASSTLSSIIYGIRGNYRTETTSILRGSGSSSIIVSRMLGSDRARIESTSKIIAEGSEAKGHIECLGVPLDESSIITSIPVLEAHRNDVQLSHEAAIGRFSEEEITYLMSKGLSEDEAMQVLIKGFVSIDVEEIPPALRTVVDRIVEELVKRSAL